MSIGCTRHSLLFDGSSIFWLVDLFLHGLLSSPKQPSPTIKMTAALQFLSWYAFSLGRGIPSPWHRCFVVYHQGPFRPASLVPAPSCSTSSAGFHATTTVSDQTPSENETKESSFKDSSSSSSSTLKRYYLQGHTHPSSPSGVVVQTRNPSSSSSTTTPSGGPAHVMATDLPRAMGGQNFAPQPVELLLASWMGCTQATALFVARQLRRSPPSSPSQNDDHKDDDKDDVFFQWRHVSLDRLEFVNITAIRDERGALHVPLSEPPPVPSRLLEIQGTIRVHVRSTQRRRQRPTTATKPVLSQASLDVLRHQTEQRCPVANMILASGCPIHVDWILVPNDDNNDQKDDDDDDN